MSFYVVSAAFTAAGRRRSGNAILMDNGKLIPFRAAAQHYSVQDIIKRRPIPEPRIWVKIFTASRVYETRAEVTTSVRSIYIGKTGAVPLIHDITLSNDQSFFRYTTSSTDHRFSSGRLTAGTYLTSKLDTMYSNTGFACVGRYALPVPLPTTHCTEYELAAGTRIQVGTVQPQFGQAGGGVEICLPTGANVRVVTTTTLPSH